MWYNFPKNERKIMEKLHNIQLNTLHSICKIHLISSNGAFRKNRNVLKTLMNRLHTFSKGISIGWQKTFEKNFKGHFQRLVYTYLLQGLALREVKSGNFFEETSNKMPVVWNGQSRFLHINQYIVLQHWPQETTAYLVDNQQKARIYISWIISSC